MKVLLVDDHPLFREGLAQLLKALDPEVQPLQAGDANAAMRLIKLHSDVDLALVDVHMPGRSGLDLLVELKNELPSVPMVVLSSDETRDSIISALDKGAVGYIPKSSTTSVMTQALRLVLVGGIYLPPIVLDNEIDEPTESPGTGAASEMGQFQDLGLTPRQLDIMRCLFRGMSTKLICRELNVQESTVKTHMRTIFETLNVHTRTQAILVASQMGVQLGRPNARPEPGG